MDLTLYLEKTGIEKPSTPLLFIHGWGMHSGMWPELDLPCPVWKVDLPGHGKSLPTSAGLDNWVTQLAEGIAQPINLCGWSLGGQIALRWAQRYPQQIQRLMLVASTPCFVRQPGWTCAMIPTVLAEFANALQQNYQQTLRRFLAIQLRGSEQERELLQQLRAALFSRGEPSLAALTQGLEILRDSDMRDDLANITQPTLIMAGERDTLTPPEASHFMAQHMPHAQLQIIPGAAHAPFLSHPQRFNEALLAWNAGV